MYLVGSTRIAAWVNRVRKTPSPKRVGMRLIAMLAEKLQPISRETVRRSAGSEKCYALSKSNVPAVCCKDYLGSWIVAANNTGSGKTGK